MAPELASSTKASLDLIGDQGDVILLGDVTETLEEGGGSVVVTTLRLDGLNDETGHGADPRLDEVLNLLEASLLLGLVLLDMLLKRVLEGREGSLGPVEAGDIELVDSLGSGGGERTEATAVEGVSEAHDGKIGRTGLGVVKARSLLLLGPLDTLTSLSAAVEHEGGLVGKLVGLRSGLSSEDLVEALGGNLHETGVEEVNPLVGGEVANGRSVDESGNHLGGLGSLDEGSIVVANGDGGDLSIAARSVSKGHADLVGDGRTHRGTGCHQHQRCSCHRSCRSRQRSGQLGHPRRNRASWSRPWRQGQGSP